MSQAGAASARLHPSLSTGGEENARVHARDPSLHLMAAIQGQDSVDAKFALHRSPSLLLEAWPYGANGMSLLESSISTREACGALGSQGSYSTHGLQRLMSAHSGVQGLAYSGGGGPCSSECKEKLAAVERENALLKLDLSDAERHKMTAEQQGASLRQQVERLEHENRILLGTLKEERREAGEKLEECRRMEFDARFRQAQAERRARCTLGLLFSMAKTTLEHSRSTFPDSAFKRRELVHAADRTKSGP